MAAKGKYLVEPSTGGPDAVAGVVKAATALVNVVDGSVQHSSKFVIQNDELTIFSSLQVFSRFHTSFAVAELHDGAQRGSFEMCRCYRESSKDSNENWHSKVCQASNKVILVYLYMQVEGHTQALREQLLRLAESVPQPDEVIVSFRSWSSF